MAGYKGYSMSNNAVAAYEDGERPLSKWTKADILEEVENLIADNELTLTCNMEKLRKAPVKALKNLCLARSSWHHTGSHYNRTDFYAIDVSKIERLTDASIDDEVVWSKEQAEPAEERWKCSFLEWSGTRKHPKAKEIIDTGVIRGDWFYLADGSKKKTTAKGFRKIEKVEG